MWRLLQASAWVSLRSRAALVDALREALSCADSAELLHALLRLPERPQEAADSSAGSEKRPPLVGASSSSAFLGVSHFGSLLLQALLAVPLADSSLVSAVLALSEADFLRLACDARGAPVLESVLVVHPSTGFSHSLTQQHALVDRVIAQLLPVARSVSGSFVVERAYRAADLPRQRAIAAELTRHARTLQRTRSGAALLRACAARGGQQAQVSAFAVPTPRRLARASLLCLCSRASLPRVGRTSPRPRLPGLAYTAWRSLRNRRPLP